MTDQACDCCGGAGRIIVDRPAGLFGPLLASARGLRLVVSAHVPIGQVYAMLCPECSLTPLTSEGNTP